MLTYLLAIVVALASFALYMSAFFLPELYRKYDLVWSGVGVFYAYEIWHNAAQIRGAVLLGQIAVSVLLGWFAWQTLSLRWEQTPIGQRTHVPQVEGTLGDVVQYQSSRLINYLQSDEFQARLPQNFDQVSLKSARVLEQSKQWLTNTLKSLQSSSNVPNSQPPNFSDRLHPPPPKPPADQP
jgi:hypothetical protein